MSLHGVRRTLDAARMHGFRLHLGRFLEAPRIEVDPPGQTGATFRLRGVVCGLCAVRTESALAATPGVEGVTVDLGRSRATVHASPGATVDARALQRALEGAVVGMRIRRQIERTVERVRSRMRPGNAGRMT